MSTDSAGGLDLDALLEHELRVRVGALQGPTPDVGRAAYRAAAAIGGKTMPLLSSLTAGASTKAAVGLATAALVIGGGSAAAAAASGSSNPSDWGKTVTQAVSNCKSDLTDGQHGIGHCVSAVASKKGQEERAAHAASAARFNRPTESPDAHGQGMSTSHPTGAPTAHPTSKPSDVPTEPTTAPTGGGSHPTPPVATPTPRHQ